ncbi:MAG: hypothetical protein ACK559_39325, partial [bacterium]
PKILRNTTATLYKYKVQYRDTECLQVTGTAVRVGTVSVMGTDEVAEVEPELQGNAPKWKDIWRID